ncbi:hydrogenase expression/formation protein HypE [Halobacillus sp. Marseille-Q1614]|uniref:hydrogenase expression/formation protein HypE n=1 Tax=Halobacillus sp. Marseille-Q1614 TaxID=2709134 RepID=UPI00156DA293|nr:hydrogenase expression/formation protein HypE [Halobacillus sp. Marseille-Q1614]
MVRRISLAHGEGGELTHQLIQNLFIESFGHQEQTRLDSAILKGPLENIAVTTDSFVVKPIFFPGGDIGKLAVTGTINDLAVSGARPEVLTAGFILEEGFPLPDLKKVVKSMAAEAARAGVRIAAGDTKVVEKGSVDGLFINTTGIGIVVQPLEPETIKEGDAVIISGTIGDHGVSIISARQELGLLNEVKSDCASLNHLISQLMGDTEGIKMMRDPTRGGLATTLVELCEEFNCTIELDELSIPIRDEVHGACDILGFDPLYLANEGKVILIVDAASKQQVLDTLHSSELGKDAQVIGRVTAGGEAQGKLTICTPIGTTRRLYRLSGMLLPRIC